MESDNGYTKIVPDRLVRIVGSEAALLACRLSAFADEEGVAHVSFSVLGELLGMRDYAIRKHAQKLQALGIWMVKKGDGKGNVTEWRKGYNFTPFMTIKGLKNHPLKGKNFEPYNKDIKKENKNAYACARGNGATQREEKRTASELMYMAGDCRLTADMIPHMTMLRYKGSIAYCETSNLAACIELGAVKFKPINN